MSERLDQRLSAATGLVFVGLMLAAAGVGFWFPGWSAEFDGTAQDWAAFYADERTSILVSALLVTLALIFLTWFIGTVHAVLRVAEGGSQRLEHRLRRRDLRCWRDPRGHDLLHGRRLPSR